MTQAKKSDRADLHALPLSENLSGDTAPQLPITDKMQTRHGNGAVAHAAFAGSNAPPAAGPNGRGGLPSGVRSSMEAAFGRSFSDVRVSEGERVRPGQLALTEGWHIDFAPGHFKPETSAGRFLLAHELTHVVQQQNGGGAAALAKSDGSRAPARPDLENEANDVASRVAAGGAGPVQVLGRVAPGESVTLAFDAREHVLAAWKANKSWVRMGDFFIPWAFTVPMADLFESIAQARKIAEKDPEQFEAVLALRVAQPIFDQVKPGEKKPDHITREEPGEEPGFNAAGEPTGEIYSPKLSESLERIDELLKIAAVDPGQFRGNPPQPGRRKTEKDFSGKVIAKIDERFYKLAAKNIEHYLNPDRGDLNRPVLEKIERGQRKDKKGRSLFPNAAGTYREHHENALREAIQQGRKHGEINPALIIEGWAGHFLTDSFSGGHIRTVRRSAEKHWNQRIPQFYEKMLGYLSERLADRLILPNPKTKPNMTQKFLKTLNPRLRFHLVELIVKWKLRKFPEIGAGMALGALPQHDGDNLRGVWAFVNGKYVRLMGDTRVNEETMTLAAQAAQLSVNEVYRAFQMGTEGKDFGDVESAFKKDGLYAAEHFIPSKVKPDEELGEADRSLPWDSESVGAMFQDLNWRKAASAFLKNKRSDFSAVIAGMEPYQREAFEATVIRDMEQDPIELLRSILDWTEHRPREGR